MLYLQSDCLRTYSRYCGICADLQVSADFLASSAQHGADPPRTFLNAETHIGMIYKITLKILLAELKLFALPFRLHGTHSSMQVFGSTVSGQHPSATLLSD